jgi:hypothetical protein
MKKTIIFTSAAILFFAASLRAQDPVPQTTTPTTPATTTSSSDKWNNHDPAKYQLLPMPQPLSTDKIFPAAGQYTVTNKEGVTSNVTITLDETNNGIVWIDGLPEGRVKAYLRKSPGTYKIPEQKLGEEKDAKTVKEGVLIYDKDANLLNVCFGCKYDVENPAVAFAPADETTATPEVEATAKKTTKKTKVKKEVKAKPVFYSGSKALAEQSVMPEQTPMQEKPASQQ